MDQPIILFNSATSKIFLFYFQLISRTNQAQLTMSFPEK